MIDPIKVPFYSNTEDNTHCFQASMRMALGYFLPEQEFSWEELDQLSAKIEGLSTWPEQMLINLRKMGFSVTMVEGFDGHAFIRDGAKYLRDTFGGKVAEWQIKNSDIPQEQRLYQEAYDQGVDIQMRIPDLADMHNYYDEGYMIIVNVNSQILNDREGYAGHFVVILSINEEEIVMNNPGLPPREQAHVPIAKFMEAWNDPNEKARSFIAIKPEKTT